MARRIEEKKPTNIQIKAERKQISDSINIDKKNQELLLKEIKEFEGVVKEQREVLATGEIEIEKMNGLIETRKKYIKGCDDIISNKRKELKELTEGLIEVKKKADGMIEDAEKEIERKIQERVGEAKQLTEEIEALMENVKTLTVEKGKLNEDIKDLSNNFIIAREELASLQGQLDEKNVELGRIRTEILELTPVKKELEELKELKKTTEQMLLVIQQKAEEAQKELDKIEKEREKRTMDLNKKEEQLRIKQESLSQLSSQLEAKEKRVMSLGATLQKHFDKQQIPIKVFE